MPFSGIDVMLVIHWQAFLLWMRGAKFRAKTPKRSNAMTIVGPVAPAGLAEAETELRRRA